MAARTVAVVDFDVFVDEITPISAGERVAQAELAEGRDGDVDAIGSGVRQDSLSWPSRVEQVVDRERLARRGQALTDEADEEAGEGRAARQVDSLAAAVAARDVATAEDGESAASGLDL
jgi:hypothetical protein